MAIASRKDLERTYLTQGAAIAGYEVACRTLSGQSHPLQSESNPKGSGAEGVPVCNDSADYKRKADRTLYSGHNIIFIDGMWGNFSRTTAQCETTMKVLKTRGRQHFEKPEEATAIGR
jgi:hypothetical protein